MRFLKIWSIILVISYLFIFFGGWMLFDFSKHVYLTTAVWALILSGVLFAFLRQSERMEMLEQRIKELENSIQQNTPSDEM